MDKRRVQVFICGLERSGNRLIAAHINRCGQRARELGLVSYFTSQIWHGFAKHEPKPIEDAEVFLVIPVRDTEMRRKSLERAIREEGFRPRSDKENIMRFRERHNLHALEFSYEALVKEPDVVGREVIAFMKLPWVPWPPVDGSHTGGVYDANTKHTQE